MGYVAAMTDLTPVKAAVCREFGAPLSIEEITVAPPGPGQVKVDVEACAICHSDIHFIDGGGGGYAMAAKQLKSQIRDGKPSSLVQESGGD